MGLREWWKARPGLVDAVLWVATLAGTQIVWLADPGLGAFSLVLVLVALAVRSEAL